MPDSLASRRDLLDEPPRQPRLRRAPRLRVLAGGKSADDSDSDAGAINTPEGEIVPGDEDSAADNASALDPIQQMFRYTAAIEHYAKLLGGVAPEITAVTQDYITLLRQVVPQAAAARLSGAPLGMAPGAGAAMAAAGAPGSPQPGGLSMLAGGAAGMSGPPLGMAPGGQM